MHAQDDSYVSFLLRLWQSDENGCLVWRASLESVQTGGKRSFATASLLTDYLEEMFVQCNQKNER
jgi:hypothetical protein